MQDRTTTELAPTTTKKVYKSTSRSCAFALGGHTMQSGQVPGCWRERNIPIPSVLGGSLYRWVHGFDTTAAAGVTREEGAFFNILQPFPRRRLFSFFTCERPSISSPLQCVLVSNRHTGVTGDCHGNNGARVGGIGDRTAENNKTTKQQNTQQPPQERNTCIIHTKCRRAEHPND